MTKKRITTILLGLLIFASIAFNIPLLSKGISPQLVINLVAAVVLSAVLVAHLRGWRWSAEVTIICMVMIITLSSDPVFIGRHYVEAIFVPALLAAALLTPLWSLAIFGSQLLLTALTVSLQVGEFSPEALGPTFQFQGLVLSILIALGIAMVSGLARQAQRQAEDNARRAEEERARAEAQAHELAAANEQMNGQLEQQRRLLDLVATLETPAVPLADKVLLAPVVGHIDTQRAQTLTSRLLEAASSQRARLVVLDITGVPLIDTAVARALLNIAQALRLLGCDVTLTGISASVAMTLTQLGINTSGITTARSPQEALAHVIAGGNVDKPSSEMAGLNHR